jgi:hypothetical protein
MPFEVKWNTRTLQRAEQEKVGKPLSLMDTSNKQRLITAMEEYASQKSPEPATAEGLRKQYERENPNWMTVPPVTDLKRFITWLEQKLISRGEGK